MSERIGFENGWARVVVQGRPDIIGIRTLSNGWYEFLVHNEALSCPYYLASSGGGTSWNFLYDADTHAYIQVPIAEPSPEPEAAPEGVSIFHSDSEMHEYKGCFVPALGSGCGTCYERGIGLTHKSYKLHQLPAPEAQAPAVTDKRPKCPDCNSVGMSHCSDPEHCGGVYWPDAKYQALRAELAQLRARVAILDAQEVELPELDRIYSDGTMDFYLKKAICRERQLLDALRAIQAWREVAKMYQDEDEHEINIFGHHCECKACAAYDALAGKEGE